MQDIQTSLEVLNCWHHLRKRLHLGEDIDEGLRVVETGEDFLRQCFLDVVHSLLFGLRYCHLWILFHLHLFQGSLESIDQGLILCLNLALLANSKGGKSFGRCLGLGRGSHPGLHRRLDLRLDLSLCLRLGAHLCAQLHERDRSRWRRVDLHKGSIIGLSFLRFTFFFFSLQAFFCLRLLEKLFDCMICLVIVGWHFGRMTARVSFACLLALLVLDLLDESFRCFPFLVGFLIVFGLISTTTFGSAFFTRAMPRTLETLLGLGSLQSSPNCTIVSRVVGTASIVGMLPFLGISATQIDSQLILYFSLLFIGLDFLEHSFQLELGPFISSQVQAIDRSELE